MITCVSLNPSIDRTLEIDALQAGGLNRVRKQTDAAAGKGVNVALALTAIGEEAECVGLLQQEGADLFRKRLAEGGASWDFTECPGAVRINVKVFDRSRGEITELNSSGAMVSPKVLEDVRALIARHTIRSDCLILSGSLPPGCPADFYRTLASDAAKNGCRVFLDADGDRLKLGIEAKPFLIKPNRSELEMLTGTKLQSLNDLRAAAQSCIEAGVRYVVVSMGAEGSMITDGLETWLAKGLKLDIKSTVAAGDSMIAGLASAFRRGLSPADALRLGAAAASARCATPPEQIISGDFVKSLAREIELTRLDESLPDRN